MPTFNHTLPIFIHKDTQVLILGSFPSVKSREAKFYYSHPRNRFFLALSKVFNEEEPIGIEERKEFLIRHKIGLYDVIESCSIKGSSDSSIKDVTPIPIKNILKEYPSIRTIGITGKKAGKLFDKYLLKEIDEKEIRIVYLSSTSPANAKCSLDELVGAYEKLF